MLVIEQMEFRKKGALWLEIRRQTTDDTSYRSSSSFDRIHYAHCEHPTAQRIRTDGGETQRRGCDTLSVGGISASPTIHY